MMVRNGFRISALLLALATVSTAQVLTGNLQHRQYETAIVTGSRFPDFLGKPVSSLQLFSYDGASGEWRAIPFQVDEKTAAGSYFGWQDGYLDPQDEIVFLYRDLGDRVPDGYWIEDPQSGTLPRYEIEVIDHANNGERAWGYLFSSSMPLPMDKSYVVYDSTLDQITTPYYQVGFDDNSGLPDEYAVLPGQGGNGADLLDRVKFRFKVVARFAGVEKKVEVNENNIQKMEVLPFPQKPVRFIRMMRTRVNIAIRFDLAFGQSYTYRQEIDSVYFPIFFYPYFMSVRASNLEIDPGKMPVSGLSVKITHIRSSQDLSEQAIGMRFWSELRAGQPPVAIDGSGQHAEVGPDLLTAGDLTWFLVTGAPGSILTFSTVPQIGSRQRIYYYDYNVEGALEWEKTRPTGDKKSIGDHGILIDDDDGDKNITGVASFLSEVYFLPPDIVPAFAGQLKNNLLHPPEIRTVPQQRDIIAPLAVTDLTAQALSDTAILLSWTAPGDDSSSGRASRYEIRYSSEPPDTAALEAWFLRALPVNGAPLPESSGTVQQVVVTGLRPLTTYFFALRTFDDGNNASGLSNIASASSLPVELVAFSATWQHNGVLLEWRTESEQNNLGFEIQRRGEKAEFETVAFVPGHFTSTQPQTYRYLDAIERPGFYWYRLKQVDLDGSFHFSNEVKIVVPLPDRFVLEPVFPNPFNPSTTVRLQLPGRSRVILAVFDVRGRLIKIIFDGVLAGGRHRFRWDARNLPTGVYFVRVLSDFGVRTTKAILLE
jgi:hypothetical protein